MAKKRKYRYLIIFTSDFPRYENAVKGFKEECEKICETMAVSTEQAMNNYRFNAWGCTNNYDLSHICAIPYFELTKFKYKHPKAAFIGF